MQTDRQSQRTNYNYVYGQTVKVNCRVTQPLCQGDVLIATVKPSSMLQTPLAIQSGLPSGPPDNVVPISADFLLNDKYSVTLSLSLFLSVLYLSLIYLYMYIYIDLYKYIYHPGSCSGFFALHPSLFRTPLLNQPKFLQILLLTFLNFMVYQLIIII